MLLGHRRMRETWHAVVANFDPKLPFAVLWVSVVSGSKSHWGLGSRAKCGRFQSREGEGEKDQPRFVHNDHTKFGFIPKTLSFLAYQLARITNGQALRSGDVRKVPLLIVWVAFDVEDVARHIRALNRYLVWLFPRASGRLFLNVRFPPIAVIRLLWKHSGMTVTRLLLALSVLAFLANLYVLIDVQGIIRPAIGEVRYLWISLLAICGMYFISERIARQGQKLSGRKLGRKG